MKTDMLSRLERARRVCKARNITQAQIATDLGASQSQVSRILQGTGIKTTRLAEEVCLYAEKLSGGVTADAVRRNDELIDAIKQTWDGSANHARALSSVIRSLAVLNAAPIKARSGS
jgi:transcriptional regulator with XRE-family HTH domain